LGCVRKGLFFDIGGTLVADPFPFACGSIADLLIESGIMNIRRRDELINALQGANKTLDTLGWSHFWGEPDILLEAFRRVSVSVKEAMLNACLERCRIAVQETYRTQPDLLALPRSRLRALLHLARDAGFHVGIISDERKSSIPLYLKVLDAEDCFDTVVTSEEAGVAKPHPEIFRLALRTAGVAATESVYVGNDYVRDIAGARGVGMKTVYFTRFNSPDVGPSQYADFVTDDLTDLICFLELDGKGWPDQQLGGKG